MLKDKSVVATIPVKDLERAKEFYGGKLGLRPVDTQEEEVAVFETGNSEMVVYRSEFAGTNQATAATWDVGDELETLVRELKAKGVQFEHYDFPQGKMEGDIHVFGRMRTAWFKDPDGNIHNLYRAA